MVVTHDFPADGEYVFTFETDFGDRMYEENLDLSIDGAPVAQLMLPHKGSEGGRRGGGLAIDRGGLATEPIFVRAGQHQVAAAFVKATDGMYEDRFSAPLWSQSSSRGGQAGITGLTHLMYLEVTGPTDVKGV